MKTCPTCHQNYEDNTLRFCLEDGSLLVAETASGMTAAAGADATLVLPGHSTEQPPAPARPLGSAPAQSTITSRGFAPVAGAASPGANVVAARTGSRSGALLVVAALIIGAAAIVVALIVTRGRTDSSVGLAPVTTTPLPSETPAGSTSSPQTRVGYSSSPSNSPGSSNSTTSGTPYSFSTPTPRALSSPKAVSTMKRASATPAPGKPQAKPTPPSDGEQFIPVKPAPVNRRPRRTE